jgi:hypothetical protein
MRPLLLALASLTFLACRTPSALRAPPPELVASSLSGGSGPSVRASGEPAPAPAQSQPWPIEHRTGLDWAYGQSLLQGFFGWTDYSDVSTSGSAQIDGDSGDLDQIPLIGGGGQIKLAGERLDFGLEGLLSFGGRADAVAFVAGGGGAVVAVDVDLLLFELYGGPFLSMFLGDRLRVYAAAGPLMQWAEWDQSGAVGDSGSGFGAGFYARTGLEFVLPSHTLIGFGVRWSDTTVDLGGDLGDLDIRGAEGLITVSEGL